MRVRAGDGAATGYPFVVAIVCASAMPHAAPEDILWRIWTSHASNASEGASRESVGAMACGHPEARVEPMACADSLAFAEPIGLRRPHVFRRPRGLHPLCGLHRAHGLRRRDPWRGPSPGPPPMQRSAPVPSPATTAWVAPRPCVRRRHSLGRPPSTTPTPFSQPLVPTTCADFGHRRRPWGRRASHGIVESYAVVATHCVVASLGIGAAQGIPTGHAVVAAHDNIASHSAWHHRRPQDRRQGMGSPKTTGWAQLIRSPHAAAWVGAAHFVAAGPSLALVASLFVWHFSG